MPDVAASEKGVTILVVDDNTAALKATARVLERAGYRVLQAADGNEALRLVSEYRPQLVLMDVVMPDLSGPDVLQRIRADPELESVSVVLLSSVRTSSEQQASGLDVGAEGYIARPIANEELLARVRAHLRQRELIDQLRATEQRLHVQNTALTAAACSIFITDREGVIEWANPAFTETSGYTLDEARGRRPGDLVKSGVQDRAFYERLWETIRSGRVWQGRIVNRHKDGELHTKEMTITPVKDARGEITHFIAVKQDITDRLALEEQLRRTQRLESIGQLTGGIAHDFNNLLTVIMGNAELLDEQLAEDSRLRPITESLVKGAQRGAELTHRLLAFARKQPLDPKVIDVNRLVTGMEQLLHRTLGEDIEIAFQCGTGLWSALIDPGQLEDALLNLCLNARDAMPEGGRLTIETGNTELDREYAERHLEVAPGEYVLVAVSDTGCGIPPEQLERVFEPFYTTKEKAKGTGLGLAMVYGFIKQSRGHIKLYSEPGEGTTVKMYLPRVMDTADPVIEPASAAKTSGGSETILLVEDDILVRPHAESLLTVLGYRVITAASGLEALGIIRERDDIDLLFTDVVMPGGMSGRELADAARAIRPGLKVLFTSGYTENAIVHHGRLDPGAQLLSKPYRRGELAAKIRSVLTEGEKP